MDGWIAAEMRPQRGSLPVTAVPTGRFNLVVNSRDQGWAPQILPQLPGMGGARVPGGLTGRDGQGEGEGEGRGEERRGGTWRERGFTATGEALMLQGCRVIRRESSCTL